jgi:hypothetical protein
VSEIVDEKDWQRKFAVDCFNGTWDLLDKTRRTPAEDARMVHMAHASLYHWGEIGTPLNFARGDWQISRVYAVLGEGVNALKYAQSCLQLCQENGIADFDLAFAFEAAARAFAVLGEATQRDRHLQLAQQAGEAIAKEDDKQYFFSELATIQ